MLHKPTRDRDEGYLDFVRGLPCGVCLSGESDPHHLQSRGAGGSDYTSIPLCRRHHSGLHAMGYTKFQDVNNINLWKLNANVLARYVQKITQSLANQQATPQVNDIGWGYDEREST